MTMMIYDTLVGDKKALQPIEPDKIRMYTCGMTVYDRCHIGHGRIFVVFDMVAQYLRHRGFEVTYVRNITDVDDKIIARALENKESIETLTQRCIDAMHEDEAALLCEQPSQEPRATMHINGMIAFIEQLIAKDVAYVAENGDVYFKVSAYHDYGVLSRQRLEDLRIGERVDVVSAKQDPLDFVLWKQAKPGEPSWDSPWGKGRPGWHIECSAMSHECLGEQMDIHGGGLDLRFPHHQNEVAQSESVTGKRFVNHWMHVGHVRVESEKMSKSLGNFSTIASVLDKYPGEVIRYFMLASHYRSPINYTEKNLQHAHDALSRLYRVLRDADSMSEQPMIDDAMMEAFYEAMDDDFNTPLAISVLFELANQFYRIKDQEADHAQRIAFTLRHAAACLGLLQQDPMAFLQSGADAEVPTIESLIQERQQAREAKDWVKADAIRDQLTAMGVELEDTSHGSIWRRLIK